MVPAPNGGTHPAPSGPPAPAALQDLLLDSIGAAVVATTPDGVITYWNRAAEDLYGWDRDEVLGRRIVDVLVRDDLSEQARGILGTLAAGHDWAGDFQVRRRDGTSFTANVVDTPVRDRDGTLLGITGVSSDVTQRRRDEAALHRAAAIVHGTREAVVVLSPDGTVLEWNPAAERVYGRPRTLAMGSRIADVSEDAGVLDVWLRARDEVLGCGHSAFDATVLRPDGTPIQVSGSMSALRDAAGEVVEIVGISRDITEASRLRAELETSLRELREAQRLGRAGSWQWDVVRDVVRWSDTLFELFGLTPEELDATYEGYLALVHPPDRAHVRAAVASVDAEADTFAFDHRVVRADGSVLWLAGTGEVAERGGDGRPLRMLGHIIDVSARKRLEEQLREQRDALAVHAAVVASTDDSIIVTSLNGTVMAWNGGATKLYGYTPAEAVGRKLSELLSTELAQRFPELLAALADGPVRLESLDRCKDGALILTSVTLSYVREGDGPPTGVVGIARDITEQRRAQEREQAQTRQLAHLAFHDPLTSLANRALLYDRLAHALVARRGAAVSVLLLDLDDFKSVNDLSGHAAGDRLLVEVGHRLQSCVRAEDTVARLGGDEFAVLVEGGEPEQVAERILDELSRPVLVENRPVVPGASIGLADSSLAGDAETLMLHADVAMYAAKAAGKGRLRHFSPSMAEGVRARADLHDDLRHAVDRGEIVVHYQPIVDVQAEALCHVEALVRWQRPDGLVPPGTFLPLAEETGLILGIGLEVLRRTCAQLSTWLAQEERRSVAVNVSARQLEDPHFAEEVPRLLAGSGVRPAQLVIEVTESLFLDPSPALIDQLSALRGLGVRVSIDDFGTGYSSLSRLQALPVDSLKIDKSFVDLIRTGEEDLPILTTMIVMAHSLGLDVTAEGVESLLQAERLMALGCDRLQGFYFARPQEAQSALTTAMEQGAATLGRVMGSEISNLTVLLVEDDPVSRAVVRMTLSVDGFDVEEAITGAEGIGLANRRVPHVVLVDLGLPDMDGLDVVRALRARQDLGSTAIVVLTGAAQRDVKAAAFAAGADDYIVKPLAPQHLAARLRGAMRSATRSPTDVRAGRS